MKKKTYLLIIFLGFFANIFAQEMFDTYFERKSLRIDFSLSGNDKEQSAAIKQIRKEPVWGGPLNNLIDHFYYGGYYINVYDKETNKLIYSRGFNTLFEEWRTTEQAKHETQAWTNCMTVPYPKKTITIELTARDKKDMQFHSLLKMDIDPTSIFIDRGDLKANKVKPILNNGDSHKKVDLVFLAEGYTAAEQDKFFADAQRFCDALFKTKPYDERKKDFNVWAVGSISEESGTDISGKGIYKNTIFNSGYYTFGLDRYLTSNDHKAMRDAVWNVPTDAIFILINTKNYGGGGMYNFYACGSADHPKTPHVFTHEFGHSFAGLADEYYSSDVAYSEFYNLKYEPWEPNITTLVNFESKWKDCLKKGTPIPTPLNDKYQNECGVFEGGGYVSKGIYRPMNHCMMNDLAPFCPVCSKAIKRMIDYYCDKEY